MTVHLLEVPADVTHLLVRSACDLPTLFEVRHTERHANVSEMRRRFAHARFSTLLLPLVMAAGSGTDAFGADSQPSIGSPQLSKPVAEWLGAQTNVHTWTADFIQTRSLKTLASPLTATGQVWFVAPVNFRWELVKPAPTIAMRTTNDLLVIYPRLKRAEKYPLAGTQGGQWRDALALLDAGFPRSETELRARYSILSQEVTNTVCTLVLQPRSAAARKMIRRVAVGFDFKAMTLNSTELEFADGSKMRNDFLNGVLNPKVDPQLFVPDLSGYKVVEPLRK